MKHNRAGQAASVATPNTFAAIESRARASIRQSFIDDPKMLKKPKIEPFDPHEDRRIWQMLHRRRRQSITQRITLVLPHVDKNAPTVAGPACSFYDDVTQIDPYATQPMEMAVR